MLVFPVLKTIHVAAVVVSGVLFCFRFYRLQRYPGVPLGKALKIAPHVNDTLLLGAAIGMLMFMRLNPLTVPWLSLKIALLLVYIGAGAVCMKAAPGSRKQVVFFIVSSLIYLAIVLTAVIKTV